MIKAIVFDCFGVLTTDVWMAFCDGLPRDADIQQASAINRAYDRGLITRQEFETGVRDAVGQSPPLLEDMAPGLMVKNQALLDLIKELKPRYKTSILSNIYGGWITTTLLTKDDQLLFDDIVQSYDVGLTKPDPKIYALACERVGVSPNEAIMVDDRPNNVTGAVEAGLQGLLYEDFPQFRKQLNQLLNAN